MPAKAIRSPNNVRVIAPYKPHPWQYAPLRDTGPVVLLTGSAGGGKSRVAAEKVHAACLKYPGAMALAVRKTRESMTNSTVLFLERTVIAGDPRVKHVAQKHRFEYANGSVLAYGGMKDDEQREQIRSIGVEGGIDLCWMEEAVQFGEDDYNELSARMRGRAMGWRQVLLSTNPGAPGHWIYKRLILEGAAHTYYSRAEDNPTNPAEYIQTLDHLTGVLKKRLRGGQWVQAEGAVYDLYRPEIHLIDPFPIPAEWRRFRIIDFGYTNPFVCQWWAIDPDGRMIRYRELYMTQRTVRVHAEQINALSAGEKIKATVCDHDAEDRATLEENGIPNEPATKDVSPGIQAVTERLKLAGDGKPRLYFMRGALVEVDPRLESAHKPTCTEEEIELYAWQTAADGRPIKEQPIKVDDHGMDCTRYAVMYEDQPRSPLIWFEV